MDKIKKLKYNRKFSASKNINTLERNWWEKNSSLISSVWEMDTVLSFVIRKNYLKRAKNFFLEGKAKVIVAEPGCGSGWVGQSLAGNNLGIVGSDFSHAQITLARKRAKKERLTKYCKYVESSNGTELFERTGVEGILIHAFLHHLDGNEINEVLFKMKHSYKSGNKIWIYEPAFYKSAVLFDTSKQEFIPIMVKLVTIFLTIIRRIFKFLHMIDEETLQAFKDINKQSRINGWYLSPKEIPMDVDIFTHQLKKYFYVTNDYWATIYIVGWVQDINQIKNKILKDIIIRCFVPLLVLFDSQITLDTRYLRKTLIAPNYAFHVWECVLK